MKSKEEYKEIFGYGKLKKSSTAHLIKRYKYMNAAGKRVAREEFARRKVKIKDLPFTPKGLFHKPKRTQWFI